MGILMNRVHYVEAVKATLIHSIEMSCGMGNKLLGFG
jgi:hypothetical protein